MESLQIKYLPLSKVAIYEKNQKLHDIGGIAQSIMRRGIQEPPKYDAALGAVISGNGRVEALLHMKAQGYEAPAGVEVDDSGEWLVPVIIGNDFDNEGEAAAYVVDANNLVLAGGDFTARDMARMWGAEYTELLMLAGDNMVTVDNDDVAYLLASTGDNTAMFSAPETPDTGAKKRGKTLVTLSFDSDDHEAFLSEIRRIQSVSGLSTEQAVLAGLSLV